MYNERPSQKPHQSVPVAYRNVIPRTRSSGTSSWFDLREHFNEVSDL